jgi:hypothetical protein
MPRTIYINVNCGPSGRDTFYVNADGNLTQDEDDILHFTDLDEANAEADVWEERGYDVELNHCYLDRHRFRMPLNDDEGDRFDAGRRYF